MQFIKKLSRGLLSLIFKPSLFLLAILGSLVIVFGTSTQLKSTLSQSGIYGSLVDNALKTAIEKSQENQDNQDSGGGIPFAQPEVQSAVKKALTPEFIQSTSEQVLDSVYRWLDQKVPTPDFKIDLSGPKQVLATSLGDYAVTRAQDLPRCTLQQLRQMQQNGVNPNKVEPFDATCVPPGFDIATLKQQVADKVVNNGDFLKDPIITADTLNKDSGKENPFQKLHQIPKVFHLVSLAPSVLGALALLSGIGLVLLHDEKRRGLRNISITFLGTGIFLLVTAWLENYLLQRANRPEGALGKKLATTNFQSAISHIVTSLSSALANKLYTFSIVFILIGGSTLLVLHFTKPKKPHHDESKTDHKKDSEESKEDPAAEPEAAEQTSDTKTT